MQTSNVILKTTNLTKRFGDKVAVDNISMQINKGDIYGLIGKNGAGKTTLMRLILSLATPNNGEISLFDGEPFSLAGKKVGSLIEMPSFYKGCTAYENLLRFSLLYGADKTQIPEILELVGLSGTANKKAGNFSLGMKQRLGIAIAMLNNPEFMILDEPVNGLDPAGIMEIRNLIHKLNEERGITFLISSHLLEELSKIVTRFGIISNGKLIEELSSKDLANRGGNKLYIKVSNIELATGIMETNFPEITFSVFENYIICSSHTDSAGLINTMLVKGGVTVTEINIKTESLEQYFLEKVGVKV